MSNFNEDKEIVLAALRQNRNSIEYVSHSLRGDRDVMLAAGVV
jgi:hypothetical protein